MLEISFKKHILDNNDVLHKWGGRSVKKLYDSAEVRAKLRKGGKTESMEIVTGREGINNHMLAVSNNMDFSCVELPTSSK